jgi:hypothetical protein
VLHQVVHDIYFGQSLVTRISSTSLNSLDVVPCASSVVIATERLVNALSECQQSKHEHRRKDLRGRISCYSTDRTGRTIFEKCRSATFHQHVLQVTVDKIRFIHFIE